MCGLIGILAKTKSAFSVEDIDLFQDLLVVDSLRGADGTGIFGVYQSSNSFIHKVGSHPYALLTHPEWNHIRSRMYRNCKAILGHNRKATHGKISNETSHPFREKHIILAHNGVITNYKEFEDTEVDSHALAHLFASTPVEEAIPQINGAYAILWYDMKSKLIHFIRNDERPLCLLETKDLWIISSEMGAVQWIAARSFGTILTKRQLIDPHMLYTWNLETLTLSSKKVDGYQLKKPSVKNVDIENGYGVNPVTNGPIKDAFDKDVSTKEAIPFVNSTAKLLQNNKIKLNPDFVKEFNKQFYIGKQVTFQPKRAIPWKSQGMEGTRLEGDETWNNIPILYKENILEKDQLEKLLNSSWVTGIANTIVVNSNQIVIWVRSTLPTGTIRTYNGVEIPKSIWANVCNWENCHQCKVNLTFKDAPLTSLTMNNSYNKVIRLFCPKCVLKKYRNQDLDIRQKIDKWSETNLEETAKKLGY